MKVEIVEESAMPFDLDAKIRRTLVACFPKDAQHFTQSRDWHGSRAAFSVVATDDADEAMGNIGVVDRTITVGGTPLRVAGLQNVCVAPTHRKTGLIDRLMAVAIRESERRGFDMGLLFCGEPLRKVYRRFGWKDVADRATTRIDDGVEVPLPDYDNVMVYPMKIRALPLGDLHLRGNDW